MSVPLSVAAARTLCRLGLMKDQGKASKHRPGYRYRELVEIGLSEWDIFNSHRDLVEAGFALFAQIDKYRSGNVTERVPLIGLTELGYQYYGRNLKGKKLTDTLLRGVVAKKRNVNPKPKLASRKSKAVLDERAEQISILRAPISDFSNRALTADELDYVVKHLKEIENSIDPTAVGNFENVQSGIICETLNVYIAEKNVKPHVLILGLQALGQVLIVNSAVISAIAALLMYLASRS